MMSYIFDNHQPVFLISSQSFPPPVMVIDAAEDTVIPTQLHIAFANTVTLGLDVMLVTYNFEWFLCGYCSLNLSLTNIRMYSAGVIVDVL